MYKRKWQTISSYFTSANLIGVRQIDVNSVTEALFQLSWQRIYWIHRRSMALESSFANVNACKYMKAETSTSSF